MERQIMKHHRVYGFWVKPKEKSRGEKNFIKIGMTSCDKVGDRFSLKWENSMAEKYNRIHFFNMKFPTREKAFLVEQELHEKLTKAGFSYRPKTHFSGFTECYRSKFYKEIKKIIREVKNKYIKSPETLKKTTDPQKRMMKRTIRREKNKEQNLIRLNEFKKRKKC